MTKSKMFVFSWIWQRYQMKMFVKDYEEISEYKDVLIEKYMVEWLVVLFYSELDHLTPN